jgi:hypothetical protein
MATQNKIIRFVTILFAAICFLLPAAGISAEIISVQAEVEKQEVFAGESFLLQIKVDGADSPLEPDLSGLQDFTVQNRGGGQNNRESITIINGKVNRVSERGYIFRYSLTPKREGILTIPAIEISAAGKTFLTQPIAIKVNRPAETDEFKLRMSLSHSQSYVGQPVLLNVTWYISKDVQEVQFNFPFLEDDRFEFADLQSDMNYQGQDGIAIQLPGGKVIARKGHTVLQGYKYTTLTFRKILIPKQAGDIVLGKGTVTSKVLTGYRQKRSRQPFDNFFEDFFSGKQGVYKQFITPSNSLTMKVLELPAENRPADFTGLVGQYSLATTADPVEVNIGDPITLDIMVTGSEYLDNVTLPLLHTQSSLAAAFKVPEEMAPGEVHNQVKTFTQTIRAKHADIKEIPSINLSYFNPDTKQYEYARSEPIPLQVKSTRIVTALDAEGSDPAVAKHDLESLDRGIAHNYVGDELLVNQDYKVESWINSVPGMLILILPPAAFLLILIPLTMRRKRQQDSGIMVSRRALQEFTREVKNLQRNMMSYNTVQVAGLLNESIRLYLGNKLTLPPGAIIYEEAKEHLHKKGVDKKILAELKEILDWCEVHHYAGVEENESNKEETVGMINSSLATIQKIDQWLKT